MKPIGQILGAIGWLLTSLLVAMKYGVVWGALNLFVPPVSLIGSVFVFTWPLFLVAIPLVVFGERRDERRQDKAIIAAIASQRTPAGTPTVSAPMMGIAFFDDRFAGPGTFSGYPDGRYVLVFTISGRCLELDASGIRGWGSGSIGVDGPADASQELIVDPGVGGAPNIKISPPNSGLIIAWLNQQAPKAAR